MIPDTAQTCIHLDLELSKVKMVIENFKMIPRYIGIVRPGSKSNSSKFFLSETVGQIELLHTPN